MTTTSFTTSLDDLINLGGPVIPEIETADPRFPFLLLVDISGSTGLAKNGTPDIDKINEAMGQLVQKLKYPPAQGPLAQVHDQIDLAVVAYSCDPVVVLDWTAASQLPDQLPMFSAGGGTAMGKALSTSLDMILGRQKRYKAQGLPKCGLPHIFHMTDGEPTDIAVGDALWTTIEQKLAKAASDPKKKSLVVRHFVAPNGYAVTPSTPRDASGQPINGASLIAKWFGANAVVPLSDGADNFQNLVEVVVRTITILSETGANTEAALAGLSDGVRHAA